MDNTGGVSACPLQTSDVRTGLWTEWGLTKREEIAKHLMAAMMDSYCRQEVDDMTLQKYAEMAVEGAEHLLNKFQPGPCSDTCGHDRLAASQAEDELHRLRRSYAGSEARWNAAALAHRAVVAERDEARYTLAHTVMGSLPNDWTLKDIAAARLSDMLKLRDQVRDTCARAEAAESKLAVLRAGMAALLGEP